MTYKIYTIEYKLKMIIKFKQCKIAKRRFCTMEEIPRSTFNYWLTEFDNETLVLKKPKSGRPTKINDKIIYFVKEIIDKNPFLHIIEVLYLCKKNNFNVSIGTIYKIIKHELKYTYKKAKQITTSKTSSIEEVLEKIEQKQVELRSNGIDSYVSIDEMAVYEEMHQYYGWSKKGTVLQHHKDKIRSKRHTLLLAISTEGVMAYKLYEKSVNKKIFKNFLSRKLIPKIKKQSILFMDNVRFHHSKEIVNYVAKKGLKIEYTVPYTPELNPIENAFSISKRHIRHKQPRCLRQLIKAINESMYMITPSKCINMFKKSFGMTDYKIVR